MSEDKPLNTKDLFSSDSLFSDSSEETTLVENTSLLPYIPAKRPKDHPSDTSYYSYATCIPTTTTNPREQQNKVGKFWKGDISLKNDEPRDLNDPNYDMMSKPPPLDSYEIFENEKKLYQLPNYYLNHD
jgi:hypothetical protein